MVRLAKLFQYFRQLSFDELLNAFNWCFTGTMVYITFVADLIEHADTWVVKVPLGILILSAALFNLSKAYEKFKNPNNEK